MNRRTLIFSALFGVGAGFVMALAVLWALVMTDYAAGLTGKVLVTVIAAALPWLADGLRGKGLDTGVLESIMIAVSFSLTMIYSFYVTSNAAFAAYYQTMRTSLWTGSGIAHAVSLAFVWIRILFLQKEHR